jgi:PAS domain S-box-containing protein
MARKLSYKESQNIVKQPEKERLRRKRAEGALRGSEEKFHNFFELCNLGMAISSSAKTWVQVNERLCEILGYSREELLGLDWTTITYPEDIEPSTVQFNQALAGEIDRYELNKRFVRKDGEIIHLHLTATCVRRPDKSIAYFIVSIQDITDLKRAKRSLRESEEKFSKLFQASPVYTVVTSLEDGRFVEVNDSFVKITGYQREEVIGRTTTEVGLWAIPEERVKFVKLAKEKGRFRDQRVELLKKKGEPLVMLWSAERAEIGGEDCFISTLADITDIEKAEKRLKKSEEKFSKLFHASPVSTSLTTTEEGRFLEVNEAFTKTTGYQREEVIGRTVGELGLWENPKARARLVKLGKEKGGFRDQEIVNVKKNGEPLIMLWSAETIKLDGTDCFISALADITELKKAHEALMETEAKARVLLDSHADTVSALLDADGIILEINETAAQSLGKTTTELIGMCLFDLLPPDVAKLRRTKCDTVIRSGKPVRFVDRLGKSWLDSSIYPVMDFHGKVTRLAAFSHSITELKQTEQSLRERENELEIKTVQLEQINTALRVLLEKREEDRARIEETVLSNVKQLVEPYILKLKGSGLGDRQMSYVKVLESNLNDVISPFISKLSSRFLRLSPTEIRIANLVKQGRDTKEIAQLMSLSKTTIATHRRNMRTKLGLPDKKANLRSHLLSI